MPQGSGSIASSSRHSGQAQRRAGTSGGASGAEHRWFRGSLALTRFFHPHLKLPIDRTCSFVHKRKLVGAWRSPVSAPVWGTGGRRFESSRSDHFTHKVNGLDVWLSLFRFAFSRNGAVCSENAENSALILCRFCWFGRPGRRGSC